MIAYQKNFETMFNGDPWFGESFKDKLAGVTDANAFVRPTDSIHSIAELVHHCIYWRFTLIKRLQNDPAWKGSMDSEANWLPLEKLKAKGWQQIAQEFDSCQFQLVALLRATPESFLDEEYRSGHKMDHLVDGVLQHDIYHLGQIGLVLKMLENNQPDS